MGHATQQQPQQPTPTHGPRATEPLPPAAQAALARLDKALGTNRTAATR